MALPPTIYAALGGQIQADTLQRILLNLAGATAGGAITMHLMIQSMGGNVGDGIGLYNFLRTFPVDLHVYNTGTVASVAVIAFLGAKHRYVGLHSTFVIHRTHVTPQGPQSATKLRALAANLDVDDARTEAILRAHTSIPPKRWKLLDSQDVLFNANEAVQFGFAEAIREFEVPPGNQIFNV